MQHHTFNHKQFAQTLHNERKQFPNTHTLKRQKHDIQHHTISRREHTNTLNTNIHPHKRTSTNNTTNHTISRVEAPTQTTPATTHGKLHIKHTRTFNITRTHRHTTI